MADKISKVVELIKLAKPKNVCVLVEVLASHTCENNVNRLDKILGVIEEGVIDPRIPVTVHLVIKRDIKEGDTQILPQYAFFDAKIKMRHVMAYDIVIIKCLDNKHLVVKVPEGIDLLPYTKLD